MFPAQGEGVDAAAASSVAVGVSGLRSVGLRRSWQMVRLERERSAEESDEK